MPNMNFTNGEIGTLLNALRTEGGEWLRYKTFHGSAENIISVSRIIENVSALETRVQEVYDNMTDEDDEEPLVVAEITESEATRRLAVAKMIIAECRAFDAINDGYIANGERPTAVWHHNHGWLHPRKYIEAAQADIEAGETTREEVADALGINVAELDVENARDRDRLQPFDPGFYEACFREVAANVLGLGEESTQDRIAHGTWSAPPEGSDADADPGYSFVGDIEEFAPDSNPFEITDGDESATAGIDTQVAADGRVRIDITVGGRT